MNSKKKNKIKFKKNSLIGKIVLVAVLLVAVLYILIVCILMKMGLFICLRQMYKDI